MPDKNNGRPRQAVYIEENKPEEACLSNEKLDELISENGKPSLMTERSIGRSQLPVIERPKRFGGVCID